MARVTEEEVKTLMNKRGFATNTTDLLEFQIETASHTIDVYLLDEYATETLRLIELWLSAHLVAVSSHRQEKSVSGGDDSATYTGEFKQGLSSTTYGQTVKLLDAKGILVKLEKGLRGSSGHVYVV